MKYKNPFYRKVMALAMFLLLSIPITIVSMSEITQKNTCLPTSMGQRPLLHSIDQMHQIISDGKTTIITEPGSYHIVENIVGNIIVDADNVFIDLNGFTAKSRINGPVFWVKENRSNVLIKNGAIIGNIDVSDLVDCEEETEVGDLLLNDGVLVSEGASLVVLENLRISNCENGVAFEGVSGNEISCCKVLNCSVAECYKAFYLGYVLSSVFECCNNCCCAEYGFDLEHCQFNKIKKCKSVRTGNSDPSRVAIGFASVSGRDNLFYECMAEGIFKCPETNFCRKASGFMLGCIGDSPGETETKIINCLVDSVTSGYNANSYGIQLQMCLKTDMDINPCPVTAGNFSSAEQITDVDWSPTGDKIAISFAADPDNGIPGAVKILQFDCCTWSVVYTDTHITQAGDNQHLEWDPTGRYLAVTTADGNNSAIFDTLYHRNVPAFDGSEEHVFKGLANPVWSRNGNYVLVREGEIVNGGDYVRVYRIDETGTEWVFRGDLNLDSVDSSIPTNPEVSPDGKFLAIPMLGGNIFLYSWSWDFEPFDGDTPPVTEMTPVASEVETSLSAVNDVAWNPIACNGRYYLVAVGTRGISDPYPNIELLGFDGVGMLGVIETDDFNDVLTRVKWSPNGKYFLVYGTSGSAAIYSFDPDADGDGDKIIKVYSYSLGYEALAGGVDWSPSGKYAVMGASIDEPTAPDFAILDVAHAPTNCMIVGNKIANVTGGLCGIGIEGSNACNAIAQNMCYECDLSFSRKMLDVWYCGLVGINEGHYNVSIPPY